MEQKHDKVVISEVGQSLINVTKGLGGELLQLLGTGAKDLFGGAWLSMKYVWKENKVHELITAGKKNGAFIALRFDELSSKSRELYAREFQSAAAGVSGQARAAAEDIRRFRGEIKTNYTQIMRNVYRESLLGEGGAILFMTNPVLYTLLGASKLATDKDPLMRFTNPDIAKALDLALPRFAQMAKVNASLTKAFTTLFKAEELIGSGGGSRSPLRESLMDLQRIFEEDSEEELEDSAGKEYTPEQLEKLYKAAGIFNVEELFEHSSVIAEMREVGGREVSTRIDRLRSLRSEFQERIALLVGTISAKNPEDIIKGFGEKEKADFMRSLNKGVEESLRNPKVVEQIVELDNLKEPDQEAVAGALRRRVTESMAERLRESAKVALAATEKGIYCLITVNFPSPSTPEIWEEAKKSPTMREWIEELEEFIEESYTLDGSKPEFIPTEKSIQVA